MKKLYGNKYLELTLAVNEVLDSFEGRIARIEQMVNDFGTRLNLQEYSLCYFLTLSDQDLEKKVEVKKLFEELTRANTKKLNIIIDEFESGRFKERIKKILMEVKDASK